MGDLVKATEDAIAAARAAGVITALDSGAVEAVRELAVKIQVMDDYFDALYEDAADKDRRPPSQDNVSIPTYLKYCESLGLTPAGRSKLAEKKPEGNGGKLGKLSAVPKPA